MPTISKLSAPVRALANREVSTVSHFAGMNLFASSSEQLRSKLSSVLPVPAVAAYVSLAHVYEQIYRTEFSVPDCRHLQGHPATKLSPSQVFEFQGFAFDFRASRTNCSRSYREQSRKCPLVAYGHSGHQQYLTDSYYDKAITEPLLDVWRFCNDRENTSPWPWGPFSPTLRVVANGINIDIKTKAAHQNNGYARVAQHEYGQPFLDLSSFDYLVAASRNRGYKVGDMLKMVVKREIGRSECADASAWLLNMTDNFCENYGVS
jgi:hypothetical protein